MADFDFDPFRGADPGFFDRVRAEELARRDWAFEERVVRRLLCYARLEGMARKLAAQVKERTGHWRLTLDSVREETSILPADLVLQARRLRRLHELDIGPLLGQFSRSRPARVYRKSRAELSPAYRLALAFGPVRRLPGGVLVLSERGKTDFGSSTVLVSLGRLEMVIEPLPAYLERVATISFG